MFASPTNRRGTLVRTGAALALAASIAAVAGTGAATSSGGENPVWCSIPDPGKLPHPADATAGWLSRHSRDHGTTRCAWSRSVQGARPQDGDHESLAGPHPVTSGTFDCGIGVGRGLDRDRQAAG